MVLRCYDEGACMSKKHPPELTCSLLGSFIWGEGVRAFQSPRGSSSTGLIGKAHSFAIRKPLLMQPRNKRRNHLKKPIPLAQGLQDCRAQSFFYLANSTSYTRILLSN